MYRSNLTRFELRTYQCEKHSGRITLRKPALWNSSRCVEVSPTEKSRIQSQDCTPRKEIRKEAPSEWVAPASRLIRNRTHWAHYFCTVITTVLRSVDKTEQNWLFCSRFWTHLTLRLTRRSDRGAICWLMSRRRQTTNTQQSDFSWADYFLRDGQDETCGEMESSLVSWLLGAFSSYWCF